MWRRASTRVRHMVKTDSARRQLKDGTDTVSNIPVLLHPAMPCNSQLGSRGRRSYNAGGGGLSGIGRTGSGSRIQPGSFRSTANSSGRPEEGGDPEVDPIDVAARPSAAVDKHTAGKIAVNKSLWHEVGRLARHLSSMMSAAPPSPSLPRGDREINSP